MTTDGDEINRNGVGMNKEKLVLTVEEVAQELRISTSLAYRQVRAGKIFSVKLGDRYLIPRKALYQLLSGDAERKAL